MANKLYDAGREGFLTGDISWTSHTIKAILVDTANYSVSLSADNNLDDVPSGARIGTAVTLTGRTAAAGIADAENTTFPLVTGPTAEALVIFRDTGVEETSRLIAYIDSAGGLPAQPNGTNVEIVWDNGTNKLFKL